MRLLEVVTGRSTEGEPIEWLTIDLVGEHVAFRRDYYSNLYRERRTWQEEGISVDVLDLPRVIEALSKASQQGGGERE